MLSGIRWPLFIFAVGTAVVLLIYLGINRDWIAVTAVVTSISAVAAAFASESAARSADAIPKIERAYILCDNVREGTTQNSWRITFKNFGKTPAIVRWCRLGCERLDAPPKPSAAPTYERQPFLRLGSGDVIAADGKFPVEIEAPNAAGDPFAGLGETRKLYLFGVIGYQDIFLKNRTTWFCLQRESYQRDFTDRDLVSRRLNGFS